MHTDPTLDIMDDVTVSLGKQLRQFTSKTCSAYKTRELPRETQARVGRQTKQKKFHDASRPTNGDGESHTVAPNSSTKADTSRRQKTLNLNTYKNHALGDYSKTIRMYGTTDSYSTEPVGTSLCRIVTSG